MDTLDKDTFPRAQGSEIRLEDPRFQNGAIYNVRALSMILHAYRAETGDSNITLETFTDMFGFDPLPLDLNYATKDQLTLLFPDLPSFVPEQLSRHERYYDSPASLPFAKEVKERLMRPTFGVKTTFKTEYIQVSFSLEDREGCRIKGAFRLNIGSKRTIDNIRLESPYCPRKEPLQ